MDNGLMELSAGIAIGVVVALLCVMVVAPAYVRHVPKERRQTEQGGGRRGQIYEQLVPYLPDFPFNPKDAQFLGRPVDFIVFDGLDEGDLRRVVFVEVKTGAATLSPRERRVARRDFGKGAWNGERCVPTQAPAVRNPSVPRRWAFAIIVTARVVAAGRV